jgi:hypothetical protein
MVSFQPVSAFLKLYKVISIIEKVRCSLYIDMRHVFAALDAINRPSSVTVLVANKEFPLPPITVDSNIDNATWVGDIGGIFRNILHRGKTDTTSIQ